MPGWIERPLDAPPLSDEFRMTLKRLDWADEERRRFYHEWFKKFR